MYVWYNMKKTVKILSARVTNWGNSFCVMIPTRYLKDGLLSKEIMYDVTLEETNGFVDVSRKKKVSK